MRIQQALSPHFTPMIRSMSFRPLFLALLMAMPVMSMAQAVDAYADVRCPQSVVIPGNEATLMMFDDELWMASAGLLLRSECQQGEILGLKADVVMNTLDKRMTYIVRHPMSHHLFYSVRDRRGRLCLYEQVPREGKLPKSHLVKLGGVRQGIIHPVFSNDGHMMVFAMREGNGRGLDLFYSWQTDDGWAEPVNFGDRINTSGDETSPFIYGNHLFFASRGRDSADNNVWRIYTTPLTTIHPDDVMALPMVGAAEVQVLPASVNSGMGDMEWVVDTVSRRCYWISQRDGAPTLCMSDGLPEGFVLSGRVYDAQRRPKHDAQVELWRGDRRLVSLRTDKQGYYSTALQAGRSYQLRVSGSNSFTTTETIEEPHRSGQLLQPLQRDMVLKALSVKKPMQINEVFGDNADVQFAADAERQLAMLRQFLMDNPQLRATFVLHGVRSTDAYVNDLIMERRLAVLRDYFSGVADRARYEYEGVRQGGGADDKRLSDWLEVRFREK